MTKRTTHDPFAKLFGVKVRVARQRRGKSAQQIADRLGIDRSYYSAVERGEHSIKLAAAVRIAAALGTTLGKLTQGMEQSAMVGLFPEPERTRNPARLTRREFEEYVPLSPRTVTRWIKEGVVQPRPGRNGGQVFSQADARFAKKVRRLQLENHGRLDLARAVALANGAKPTAFERLPRTMREGRK
jgi:DNA-binding XRE family transcriptional regulator